MKKMHLETVRQKVDTFVRTKAIGYATTLITMGLMFSMTMAYADNATTLFELIIDILGKIFLAIGAFLGIMGIAHYAIANGDGDGPAKRKATMEMASGVAVIVVSIAIVANKSKISGLLTSS